MKAFWLLGVLLLLAGCETPGPPPAVPPAPLPGSARGVDLPIDARDVSSELRGSGIDFVARYYRDPASRWPTLSAEEARSVSASGMRLVVVFESHSHQPAYFSYASGYNDGQTAYRQARQVGQPFGSAIYFAVDYNAAGPDIQGPIDRYFRGVLAGMTAAAGHAPEYRMGVYGSGSVCLYLKQMRLVQYTWLSNSTAWYGYNSLNNWNIRQGMRLPTVSFDNDSNEARGEYGGFMIGAASAS